MQLKSNILINNELVMSSRRVMLEVPFWSPAEIKTKSHPPPSFARFQENFSGPIQKENFASAKHATTHCPLQTHLPTSPCRTAGVGDLAVHHDGGGGGGRDIPFPWGARVTCVTPLIIISATW
ncbi:hypothetical protein E2C01_058682 [Portunus trituberculatus]|uniref:Uncharacterized protein n=1 Tax=Portunus trituberculatus TaxID=210409 RepID=A0A5B7H6U0_PORTR|nr:hypothetical protein [Portunus trituberculatus]